MLRRVRYRCFYLLLSSAGVFILSIGLTAAGQRPARPLSPNEIIQLLESGVSSARVQELIEKYGIAFEPTPAVEAQLQEAGASEELLSAIRQMKPGAPREETSKTGAVETGVLVIEAPPGGAQVYLDDEPVGRTSSRGRLKLSALSADVHEVRISLDGYQDHEETFDLAAQQTLRLVVKLQPTPLPAPEPAKKQTPAPNANPTDIPPPGPQEPRYPVAHDHAKIGVPYCLGWLTVGEQVIRFQAVDNVHIFNFPLPLIKEVKRNDVYLSDKGGFRIRLKDGTNYNFSFLKLTGPPNSFEGVSRSKNWQAPDTVLTAITNVMQHH